MNPKKPVRDLLELIELLWSETVIMKHLLVKHGVLTDGEIRSAMEEADLMALTQPDSELRRHGELLQIWLERVRLSGDVN